MLSIYFIKSLMIGFTIAAAVGPITIICLRIGFSHGGLNAFIAGLGAACADALYGALAAFGLYAIFAIASDYAVFGIKIENIMHVSGAVFIIYLGTKFITAKPKADHSTVSPHSTHPTKSLSDFSKIFFLTLTNPMTIISFLGIFSSLGIANNAPIITKPIIVMGIFAGSTIWWAILALITSKLSKYFKPSYLTVLDKISGSLLLLIGCYLLFQNVASSIK